MIKYLTLSVATVALLAAAPVVQAETVTTIITPTPAPVQVVPSTTVVTTKTHEVTKDMPNTNRVNFDVFDVNGDGSFSMAEVGERLFYSFDLDGNETIDNIEWSKRSLMTIVPSERETFKFVDYDGDGMTDNTTYTYETFYKASDLVKFDQNEDGLSPEEFIGVGFQKLDLSDNNLIELKEWKAAYLESRAKHNTEENYN
jgi:hypothetical protein